MLSGASYFLSSSWPSLCCGGHRLTIRGDDNDGDDDGGDGVDD